MSNLSSYEEPKLIQKLGLMNWGLIILICMIGTIGFMAL